MKTPSIRCWSCGKSVSTTEHFCPACGRIQPLAPGIDYFQFFGLGEGLNLDLPRLEATFHELSRQLHPDYFFHSSPEEQRFAMERSSFLNDAYRTLRVAVTRAKYRLSMEGVDLEEGKGKTPPDLLREVFELNEELEQIRALKKTGEERHVEKLRERLRKSKKDLEVRLNQLDKKLQEIFLLWDRALSNGLIPERQRSELVKEIKENLSYRSFIRNLSEDLENEV